MRRRAVLHSVLLLSTLGCNSLLGVDFEGHLPDADVTRDAQAEPGTESDATTSDENGGDAGGDSVAPDGADASATSYLSQKPALDALRVRIADAPSLDKYFTSKSWVYWFDGANAGHAFRPTDNATRAIAQPFQNANDDFVVYDDWTTDTSTIRRADTGTQAATFAYDSASPQTLAFDEKLLFFSYSISGPESTSVLAWSPTSPAQRTPVGSVPSAAMRGLGHGGYAAYFVDPRDTSHLWVVDLGPAGIHAVPISVQPQAVVELPQGLVVMHVVGSEAHFQLVPSSGGTLDVSAQIAAATSDVPVSERSALGPPASYGDWLLFPARSGVLAFRPKDARLIPVQLRSPQDRVLFNGIHVAEAAHAVVFSIPNELQGLYFVKLDAVLPPG